MKLLLEYEDVVLHLQYNAKKEFFSTSVYPPNPECKDGKCVALQESKKGKPGYIEERKKRVSGKVKEREKSEEEKKIEEEEKLKWCIEEVKETKADDKKHEAQHEKVIESVDAGDKSLEDLMKEAMKL